MNECIVMIDGSDSFIARSVVKNLEGLRHKCIHLGWSIDDMEKNRNCFSDIVIAYIDSLDSVDGQALIYLRDLCIEDNRGLYFMGHEQDIKDVQKLYSITAVAGTFLRPINANEVAMQIAKMASDNPLKHRKHILVVDDSGTMLTTIQSWLGDQYRVSVVNSAMNAITFLSKSIPDLILLDYEMPGCSGAQLLEMLRTDLRTEKVPVIFLTGKDDPDSVRSVLSLKPDGYLLKTMPKEYILRQIHDFFEKKKNL